MYRRLGGGPFWTCAENLAPTGILSPDRPAYNSVATPTELHRPTRPTQPSIQRVRGGFPRGSGRRANFTLHLHTALELRLSGAVPLFLRVPPPRALRHVHRPLFCRFPPAAVTSLSSQQHTFRFTLVHISFLTSCPPPLAPHFSHPFTVFTFAKSRTDSLCYSADRLCYRIGSLCYDIDSRYRNLL